MTTFAYMTVATDGFSNPEFDFCDRIRKVRREVAHMTQAEFARELGTTQKAYAAWESGRTKPDNIVNVARKIEFRWRPRVTAAWVLGVETAPTPPTGPGADVPPKRGGNQPKSVYLAACA